MAREPISLEAATGFILEECRMVLPGIQTLFGFQLIAVFSDTFHEKLSEPQQLLHLAATVLVAVSVALVMAPAALHRRVERHSVSERFIDLSSRLLLAGMFPLAVAIALEAYLVSAVILGRPTEASWVAAGLLVVFAALWLGLPARERRRT
jgi:Family of unknown function (DUF6328)